VAAWAAWLGMAVTPPPATAHVVVMEQE
jgi:hypothetical protein